MKRSATFSGCRTWRYALYRRWDETLPWCMFIGLNPSTADETEDDPTIRRCIGFAKDWGYGGLIMCNLYGFRSTDPKGLLACADPVGPRNDEALAACAGKAALVVAAWGMHAKPDRADAVVDLLGGSLCCLGRTLAGFPKHPSRLRKDTPLEAFRAD